MRKFFITALFTFIYILVSFNALSQLTVIRDFVGSDFDIVTKSIISKGDSLYILTQGGGENDLGSFFKIDKDGLGYTLIKSFDSEARDPKNMIGNDSIVYGTTRFGVGGSGKLFRYSYNSGVFEFIKNFNNQEGYDISLKYITDSVIWGYTRSSTEDNGSVFTINLDGTNFTKIYNNTNLDNGESPSDICIINNEIFVSFYNGGGIPFEYGDGQTGYSGSILKMDLKGENITYLVKGGIEIGTQPGSLAFYNDRIYGRFDYTGNEHISRLFSCKLDGTDFKSLASTKGPGRGEIKVLNDSIYGNTSEVLFAYDISSNTNTYLTQYPSSLGFDTGIGPFYFKNAFIIATCRAGFEDGGSIMKFVRKNTHPQILNPIGDQFYEEGFGSEYINVPDVFKNDSDDILSYELWNSDNTVIETFFIAGNILKISEINLGTSDIIITASYKGGIAVSDVFSITVAETTSVEENVQDVSLLIYPNPTFHSINIVQSTSKTYKLYEIYHSNGSLVNRDKFSNRNEVIYMGHLEPGTYFIKLIGKDTLIKKVIVL